MATVVLDACAIIAFLRNEEGANIVGSTLLDNDCMAHAINLCEVYKDCLSRGQNRNDADQILEDLASVGLVNREDMDADLWKYAAELKASLREISYADCFALAITRRVGGVLFTSDRHELGRADGRGICTINFIR